MNAAVSTTDNSTVVQFDSFFTEDSYSPYSLIRTVNIVLELGGKKILPTQMGYNYSKNGLINGVKGAKKYTKSEAIKWANKYLNKNHVS